MTEYRLVVAPHVRTGGSRHPNAFDAYLSDRLVTTSETPLLDAARALLKAGLAQPDDVLVMRHLGSSHDALRGKVGRLAELTISEPKGAGRLRLVKRLDFTTVWPRIEQTPEQAPEQPSPPERASEPT